MQTEIDDELKCLQETVIQVASAVLINLDQGISSTEKSDRSLVTHLDQQMQHDLLEKLRIQWPDCPALAEESPKETQHNLISQTKQALWIIDPLDGTTNLVKGMPYFAVSVAQVLAGQVKRAVIYDPVHRECFSACREAGAWLNEQRISPTSDPKVLRDAVALIDYKRLPEAVAQRVAATPPFRSQRNFGAAALEWCWIACGRSDVYLHGGQQIWDYAAGQLVLEESGGRAVDLSGAIIQPQSLQPRSVVAASHAGLFQQWHDWLRSETPA